MKLYLSAQEKWNKIAQLLEDELEFLRESVVREKARQPICSAKTSLEKSGKGETYNISEKTEGQSWKGKKFSNVNTNDDSKVICKICGKKDHKTYVSGLLVGTARLVI